jgi:hypothetical protein
MQTEELCDSRCNFIEALMTFEVGNESEMFLLPNGRVISLRKQNAIIEETQLVIVIAKDCTDGKNLK